MLALTICLFILCGCSKSVKYEEMYTDWRDAFLATNEHSIQAVVTAQDEKKAGEFTLLYTLNAEGETVEVLAPEMIAKVKARLEDGKTDLSYDGVILETGSSLSEQLSPLMSLATFMDILAGGHPENSWQEKKDGSVLLVTELEMPDGTILTLWQNQSNMSPVYADIRSADSVEIKIKFTKVE